MKILAIETATEACSAALLTSQHQGSSDADSETDYVIHERFQHAPRLHTQLILPMINEVLEEGGIPLKDIDAIAFGRGPGAFTGLRIAAGFAQGLALSVDIPVVAVSTLAALAQQAILENRQNSTAVSLQQSQPMYTDVVVALDARMDEVYWARYKVAGNNSLLNQQGDERVDKPEHLFNVLSSEIFEDAQIGLIGSGFDVYENQIPGELKSGKLYQLKNCFPASRYIAQLAVPLFEQGLAVSAESAQPIYIRDNVAEKCSKQSA